MKSILIVSAQCRDVYFAKISSVERFLKLNEIVTEYRLNFEKKCRAEENYLSLKVFWFFSFAKLYKNIQYLFVNHELRSKTIDISSAKIRI